MNQGIKDWEDARGLGLFIGGTVAPPITFLGLHLSDKRLAETKQQNANETINNFRAMLSQAIDDLDHDTQSKRIFGLISLQQTFFESHPKLLDTAFFAITSYVRRNIAFSGDMDRDTTPARSLWGGAEPAQAMQSFFMLHNQILEQPQNKGMVFNFTNVHF